MPNKYDLRESVHELDASLSQTQRVSPNLCIIIDQLRDLIGDDFTDLDAEFKIKLTELQVATHYDFTEQQHLLIDKVVNEAETLYSSTITRRRLLPPRWLNRMAPSVTLFSTPPAEARWRMPLSPPMRRHRRNRWG